jgi:hypothetical protein
MSSIRVSARGARPLNKRELRRLASAAERDREIVINHLAAAQRLSHEDAALLYDHSTSTERRRWRAEALKAAS